MFLEYDKIGFIKIEKVVLMFKTKTDNPEYKYTINFLFENGQSAFFNFGENEEEAWGELRHFLHKAGLVDATVPHLKNKTWSDT